MKFAILLCTYNGADYIDQQLSSIERQSESDWKIYASDDGSQDGTWEKLHRFQARNPNRCEIFKGPGIGFAGNFFSLVNAQAIDADYFVFCDQDDEWMEQKLERAAVHFSPHPANRPQIYGSRSEYISAGGAQIGSSKIFRKKPSFRNALVQSMVTGNTMVLNRAALNLLRQLDGVSKFPAHDWMAYILVMGANGLLHYDRTPTIKYRQHGANIFGSNTSFKAKMRRITKLLDGDFAEWNSENINVLQRHTHLLTANALDELRLFARVRERGGIVAVWRLIQSGIYRQTLDGQFGLLLAAALKKL